MTRLAPLAIVVAAASALMVAAGPASAADPDAPPGAPPTWLPKQTWVLDHWLPYDETRLYAILHVDRKQVLAWERDESHTLGDLARSRGVSVRTLPARLVGPRGHRSPALYRTLLYRAGKTLSQPHLAHHMWGHLFHVRSLIKAEPRIFAMTIQQMVGLHQGGASYAEIAVRGRRTRSAARADVLRVLGATMSRAVRLQQMPRSQARRWLALESAHVDHWLDFSPGSGGGGGGAMDMQMPMGGAAKPAATPLYSWVMAAMRSVLGGNP